MLLHFLEPQVKVIYYKVAPSAYLGAISRSMLGRMWWLLIPAAGALAAGLFDWRYAAVGLILLFLVFPITVTTALMNHAMRPEVIRRAAGRKAVIDGDRATIYHERAKGDEIEYIEVESMQIIDTEPGKTYTKLVVKSPTPRQRIFDFLLVPTESF